MVTVSRLSCSELHSVQMELFTCFMAWDYFRVVALLPQALGEGNPGLVFGSFRSCWFTQAAGLALDCFVDLLPFRYIAAFHVYLTNTREILLLFSILLGFRLTLYQFPLL